MGRKKPKVRPKLNTRARQKDLGNAIENLIKSDLRDLKKYGFIEGYKRSKHYSNEDIQGIDFIITMKDSKIVPLQVKSSVRSVKSHRREFPDIPSIANPIKIENRLEKLKVVFTKYTEQKIIHLNPFSKIELKTPAQ